MKIFSNPRRDKETLVGAPLVGALRKGTHKGCPYETRWWRLRRTVQHQSPEKWFLEHVKKLVSPISAPRIFNPLHC